MALSIALVSGKGGVGKSSCTAGLANAFLSLGKSVLAVDCDIGLRSLDILLGFSRQVVFAWGDVLRNNCSLSQALLKRGRLSLLAAPLYPSESYDAEKFALLQNNFRESWDIILLDAPAGFSAGFSLAVDSADMTLIVTQPEAVSARAASACLRELKTAHPQLSARLLINRLYKRRVQGGVFLNIDETIDAVGLRLAGVIPEDPSVAENIGHGNPLPISSSSSQAFVRTARRLLGEDTALKI